MRILALDTTTLDGSVVLLDGEHLSVVRCWTAEESHSTILLSKIQECLEEARIRLAEISYLVGILGPGSFTGIRIGLGTLEGLAQAASRPCIGLTALEVLADGVPHSGDPIIAAIDARRGQVFAQEFLRLGGFPEPQGPPICEHSETWLAGLAGDRSWVVGSGAVLHEEIIRTRFPSWHIQSPERWLALPAARLALRKLQRGKVDSVETIDALYVRPPDVFRPRPGA